VGNLCWRSLSNAGGIVDDGFDLSGEECDGNRISLLCFELVAVAVVLDIHTLLSFVFVGPRLVFVGSTVPSQRRSPLVYEVAAFPIYRIVLTVKQTILSGLVFVFGGVARHQNPSS
jgi:hypothetical protein